MQSGSNSLGSVAGNLFPKELKGGLLRSLDRDFAIILGSTLGVIFITVFILAHRPLPLEANEKQVMKIQERYARLVLNVKKPKPPPIEKKRTRKKEEKGKDKKEKKKIDRKQETVAEKQARKERTREERIAKRERIAEQVSSMGIFAAITSSSDDGEGDLVQDLIGEGDISGDLSAISGESFVGRGVDVAARRRRRGARAAGGSIAKSKLSRAEGAQVQRRGQVGLSEKPEEIEGEATQHAKRTHDAIGRVIRRQQARLVYVYEKWLKKDPNLSGKLMVKFTIKPTGRVTGVSIVSSSTGNPEFDGSIIRYVKRWKFPAIPDNAGSVTVVYPFVFTGVKG